jgi:excisionase family DNA binding protein
MGEFYHHKEAISMPTTLPENLTIRETSKYLRIPLRSMYKLAQEGKIPCQKIGWRWQFRKKELDRWLDQRTKSSDPQNDLQESDSA